MKIKKINKAIKTLKKFCESHPDDCFGCPFKSKRSELCSLSNIPLCYPTIKDIQKER